LSLTIEAAPKLPDWLERELPFRRFTTPIDTHRIHFIDHGEGRPVLLVHGNPMWCFLWRKVITRLARHPVRVIAPDLFGFGLSSKPRRVDAHRLRDHIDVIAALVTGLGLDELTVVGQDWGGPIAAGVGAKHPELVRAAVFGNTAVLKPARPFRPKAFHRFSHAPIISDLVFRGAGFPLQVLHKAQGDAASIGPLERRAYRYPLARIKDRVGPMALARMVPNAEQHPSTAVMDEIGAWAKAFEGRTHFVWGTKDPILGRGLKRHRAAFPQAEATVTEAGHFLQEEVPEALAAAIAGVTVG